MTEFEKAGFSSQDAIKLKSSAGAFNIPDTTLISIFKIIKYPHALYVIETEARGYPDMKCPYCLTCLIPHKDNIGRIYFFTPYKPRQW